MSMMRAWIGASLGMFVAACGPTAREKLGNPNDQRGGHDTIVIMPGEQNNNPAKSQIEVAGEEPQGALVAESKPGKMTDGELAKLVRDPRRQALAPRHTQLLITEIQALEALFSSMPAASPDRPELMRRLANDYAELKFGARRERQEALAKRGAYRPNDPQRLEKLATAARQAAIKYYAMLIEKHPTYCQTRVSPMPTKSGNPTEKLSGCIDDALYFATLEFLELESFDQARKFALNLIKSFPQSPFVPYAYLMFGEMFYAEALTDPAKLEYASKSYEQILKFPPSENGVYGFANYRRGQIYHQEQNDQMAMAHFVKAIEFSSDYANLNGAAALGNKAREAIVPVYANVGAPRKAENFFHHLANDPPGPNTRLEGMLDALVSEYLRNNKRVEASDVCFSYSGGGNTLPACRSLPNFQASP